MQLPSAANAQDLESSYFMEGSTYRHRMNPAFINESNYINLPFIGIGNMNINVSSDFGMSNFLYPAANGSLTTFMNPSVSSEQFLSGLNTKNRLGLSLSTDILSVGFYGIAGGYSTIELGIKSDTWLNLPYNVFALLKNGMYDAEGTSYDLNGISATSNNYVQLSFGHSRYVLDDVLSVGAKVKVLFGIANATATIDGNAYLSQDKWQIDASGSITGSLQGARFTTDAGGIVNGLAIDKYGIAGYGAALDLGAYFDMKDFVEGLAISASVTDLGFISWNNSITAQMEHGFIFEGFENPIGEGSSLNDEINALGQDLKEFIKFRPGEDIKSRTSMLSAKMFIIFVAAFVPCVINSYLGIRLTDQVRINVAKTFGASDWEIFTTVCIPSSMNMVFTGVRLSLNASWTTLCAAEMLAATRGLGYMIQLGRTLIRPDIIIVGMFTIGFTGALLNKVLGMFEKKVAPWRYRE